MHFLCVCVCVCVYARAFVRFTCAYNKILRDKMETYKKRKIQISLCFIIFSCLICWYFFEKQVNQLNQGSNLIDRAKLSVVRLDSVVPSYNSPCACMRNSSVTEARRGITSIAGKLNLDWCSTESTLRGPNQKVVSFSLFGNADERGVRYFSYLRENAIRINQVLPGKFKFSISTL